MKKAASSWRVAPEYNLERIQLDFARCRGEHYLDHAGATLYSDSQIQRVFTELQENVFGNPHSRHIPSDTATQIIEATRQRILKQFNTTLELYDVIFTSGATAADKIVAENFDWNSSGLSSSEEIPNGIDGDEDLRQKHSDSCLHRRGAFLYQQENHTSVLGMRECADRYGAEVHSLSTKKLREILDGVAAIDPNTLSNGNPNSSSHMANKEEFCIPKKHCLFAYSPQCNFSGAKAPLDWIEKVQSGALNELLKGGDPINKSHGWNRHPEELGNSEWYVMLDAAGLVATCPLDLSKWKPDFVTISFYKILGYPTGLGCLLVSKRAWGMLRKTYFGGGTVLMADSRKMTLVPRPSLHDRFEDGTLPYLNIIAVRHGLDVILRHTGGMKNIQYHVYNLARYTHHCLRSYRHSNGQPVAEFYMQNESWNVDTHGSIVNFNLLKSDGSYVGYAQVERMASSYSIHLRTGCVCNPGACQTYLKISEEVLKRQFQAGHVCGDAHDLVDGLPTGSIRVSFGYMSTYENADCLLKMIADCFVQGDLQFDTTWLSKNSSPVVESDSEKSKRPEFIKGDHGRNGYERESLQQKTLPMAAAPSNGIGEQNRADIQCRDVPHPSPAVLQKSAVVLKEITVYPVKSCGGVSVKKWKIGSKGLQYDRKWMIVKDSCVTMTQKRLPQMCLIETRFDLENNKLILSYRGKGECSVPLESPPLPHNAECIPCGGRVCGDRVRGLDCGEEVGRWLSEVLGRSNLKLIRQVDVRMRRRRLGTEGEILEELSLANESQYLLLHMASVRSLVERISETGVEEINEDELVKRFRGNFILDGGRAFEEDNWRSVTIDKVYLQVQGGCRRCEMIGVITETGARMREPMLTLENERGSSMMFGIYAWLSVGNGGSIQDDESITVSVGSVVTATT